MPPNKAKRVTHEEMEALARKMDEDLEAFIEARIAANVESEPFDFQKTLKEIDNHPAFMKEFDPSKPMTPELEALIQMKYEEVDDLCEKANQYKEDGNRNFKISKYRWAVDNYTVAINCRCKDQLINAVCYTNRAAAQYRLGNYLSAFRDVVFARKFIPTHMKAIIRGVQCLLKTGKLETALRWIDDGLAEEAENKELLQYRQEALNALKIKERDDRKEKAKQRKEDSKRNALLLAIKDRGVRLKGLAADEPDESANPFGDEWDSLFGKSANSEAVNARVFLDDYGNLHWPVLFLYPEYGQTDLVSQANENTGIADLINEMFGPSVPVADWDLEAKYKPGEIEVYFEDKEKEALYQIDVKTTLKVLLSHERYVVYGGLPSVILLVKNCAFTEDFLKKYCLF